MCSITLFINFSLFKKGNCWPLWAKRVFEVPFFENNITFWSMRKVLFQQREAFFIGINNLTTITVDIYKEIFYLLLWLRKARYCRKKEASLLTSWLKKSKSSGWCSVSLFDLSGGFLMKYFKAWWFIWIVCSTMEIIIFQSRFY